MRSVQIKEDDKGHKSDITITLKSATVKKIFLCQKHALYLSVPSMRGPNTSRGKEQLEARETPSRSCEKEGTILSVGLTKNSILKLST